jgi:hypothetical protein
MESDDNDVRLNNIGFIVLDCLLVHFDTIRETTLGTAHGFVVVVVGSVARHLRNCARQAESGTAQIFKIVTAILTNHELFSYTASCRLRDKHYEAKHGTVHQQQGDKICNAKLEILAPLGIVTGKQADIHKKPKANDKKHH